MTLNSTSTRFAPGTYALILACVTETRLRIGKLGTIHLQPGYFVYVGSAFGPGGLSARLSHHRRPIIRPHWHIDYLRPATILNEIWLTYDPSSREHQWADLFARIKHGSIPLPGFGSTDCSCGSHLFFFRDRPSIQLFRRHIGARMPSHGKVLRHIVQTPAPSALFGIFPRRIRVFSD
jgi:Uri superfamily endonuclease